jgi:phosphomethylpyrimidine synthase
MSRARYAFDWDRQFELALDPETARRFHEETKTDDCFVSEEFCSMCGPRFCSMRLNRKLEDRYGGLVDLKKPGAE